MADYRGPWCNERQPGKWEDCVAATGININNAVCAKWGEHPRPITDAEREALRVDSKDTQGGMSLSSLADGMEKRYGHRPRASADWDLMLAPAGGDTRAWAVIGDWQSLPARLKHWDPTGQYIHCVGIIPDGKGTRWIVDPQMTDGFPGESITIPELKAFMGTQGYRALSFSIAPATVPPPVEPEPIPDDRYDQGRRDEWDRWNALFPARP